MPNFQLSSPCAGQLFTIAVSDWTAISKRVGLTILAQDISQFIAQRLPSFPALESACQAWSATTFPSLVSHASQVTVYCDQSTASFGRLKSTLATLNPDDALPENVRLQAVQALSALATSTINLSSECNNLALQVRAFLAVNEIVDKQILDYEKQLGAGWPSLEAQRMTLEAALGHVVGGWQAISDDLSAIAAQKIPITITLLLSLEIQSALLSWQNLRAEAVAFAALAQGQQQFLSGAWLKE